VGLARTRDILQRNPLELATRRTRTDAATRAKFLRANPIRGSNRESELRSESERQRWRALSVSRYATSITVTLIGRSQLLIRDLSDLDDRT